MNDAAATPDATQAPIPADVFRKACGQWATGVSIVTTVDGDGRPFGLTMNAVTSLSLDPPMFLVCLDHGSDTLAPMTASRAFCVNVLADGQQDLSNRFAKKGADKFDGVDWRQAASGAPALGGALIAIDCEVRDIYAGGDHQIVCGEVCEIIPSADAEARPLLYFGGAYAGVAGA